MNIQTAFSVGQSVWFMDKDTKKNAQISTIVIVASVSGEIDISYKIKGFAHSVSEQELIKTMFEIKTITQPELKEILEEHALWLENKGGKQADLSYANLQGVDLSEVNLQRANLQGADLRGADLYYADLEGANLQGANLKRALLMYANLEQADLQGANLVGVDFSEANLYNTTF